MSEVKINEGQVKKLISDNFGFVKSEITLVEHRVGKFGGLQYVEFTVKGISYAVDFLNKPEGAEYDFYICADEEINTIDADKEED